jgi:hypothetical protein
MREIEQKATYVCKSYKLYRARITETEAVSMQLCNTQASLKIVTPALKVKYKRYLS